MTSMTDNIVTVTVERKKEILVHGTSQHIKI